MKNSLVEFFESATDDEMAKMPELVGRLRVGFLEWKRSGKLPNDEEWKPATEVGELHGKEC